MPQPKSITYAFADNWHVIFRRKPKGWEVFVQQGPRDHWTWEADKRNGSPSQAKASSFLHSAKNWFTKHRKSS